jgi:hypothetical protein
MVKKGANSAAKEKAGGGAGGDGRLTTWRVKESEGVHWSKAGQTLVKNLA